MISVEADILKRVTKTLRGVLPKGSRETAIGVETDLQALGMDSLNFLEFLLALEDEFGLRLTDDALRLKAVHTVSDALELVGRAEAGNLA